MSGSHSMKGKHSWLHLVNYLIYASIPLTMISCSWDRFRASYQGVFSPLLICWVEDMEEDQQKTLNFKKIIIITKQIVRHLPTGAEMLLWLLCNSPVGSYLCCSWNCQLSQCEFRSGVLVANIHLTWPGAWFLGAVCLSPIRNSAVKTPR